MKNLFILLFLFFTCCSNNEEEKLAFLNESLERASLTIHSQTDTEYSIAEAVMQETPVGNKKFKAIVDSIHLKSQKILDEVDIQLNKKNNEKIETRKLLLFLNEFNILIDNLCKNKSIYSGFIDKVWSDFQVNTAYYSRDEMMLLKNKVLNTCYWAVYGYVRKMRGPDLKPNKLKIAVVPESETVLLGDSFVADIILGATDSVQVIKYQVDGKNHIANEYEYSFKENVITKKGIVKKDGKLFIKLPRTGKVSIIPFILQYKVLEN